MNRYHEISRQFYGNRLLFGDPAEDSIVALEIATPGEVEIFRRREGVLTHERRPLQLFLLLADRELMKGTRLPHQTIELAGDFRFRYLVTFGSFAALEAAKRHLRSVSGKTASAADAPYFVLTDPVEQHLMMTGTAFFIGLGFQDLRRLQLAIETYTSSGFGFASAGREGDRITAIAITDSTGFERVLDGHAMDERAMLEELVQIVRERDPDVIEGHNLFRFDLEYLEQRARRHKIKLTFGRNGAEPRARAARLQVAERAIAYRRYEIYGRSVIDTWILAQFYDLGSRELEGFGLRELAEHFRIAGPDRVYLDPARMSHYFDHEPALLMRSALEDAREAGALAALLAPSYFVQAQIFPYSFQNVVLRGNATRIDALLIRNYLTARHSIPAPAEPAEVLGGHTEVRRCGVARNVLHCDVTSLYPSLMLQHGHAPLNDRLGVFLKLLGDLRSFRIEAKNAAAEVAGAERRNLEAMQQTFKILINSFYGYLGFGLGHFNDFAAANNVTRGGRDLIRKAIGMLEGNGAQVIECDTDGIYFVAPFALEDAGAADALLEKVAAAMPAGIRLEIDGRYPAMFSYKMKNYVLLDEAGETTIRGSGLRSRGLERFQRRFMEDFFRLLLSERRGNLPQLYEEYRRKIEHHEFGIADLMKTETLQDSLEVYRQKIAAKRRNPAAAYELALRAERQYQSGDQISYYVSGRGLRVKVNATARMAADFDPANPDENVEYYQAKLADLYEKFRPFADRPGLFPADAMESAAEPAQPGIFDAQK
ncbi:MAG TPA: DNA polymerase domain-containing protein [Candidatus Binataceae bacterium]|nr:DNA polymerase domain-containing protein [Candidatus Binataceae bacterium]